MSRKHVGNKNVAAKHVYEHHVNGRITTCPAGMASNEECEEAQQERLRRERDRNRRPSETPEERNVRYHIRTPKLNQ